MYRMYGFYDPRHITQEKWSPAAERLIDAGAYPGFYSMKWLEVFLLPLDGMLVHCRSLPQQFIRFPQQFAGTHLYSWVERGTVRVKCLASRTQHSVPGQGLNLDCSLREQEH